MKYAVEISSDAIIYAPIFIKISPAIQKHGDGISLSLLFQNKESRLERSCFGYAGIDGGYIDLLLEKLCEVLAGFSWLKIGSS
jgi:hypothetical protein